MRSLASLVSAPLRLGVSICRLQNSHAEALRRKGTYNARLITILGWERHFVLEFGLTLLLSAHLLCVNVASGGPLVAASLDWRGTRGDGAAAKAAAYLGRASLVGLLAGAALGLV